MWQICSHQIDTSLSCEWIQRSEQPDPNVAWSSAKKKSKDKREHKDGSRQSLLLITLHLVQDCSLIELASLNLAPASDLRSWLCLSGNLHTIFVTLSKEDRRQASPQRHKPDDKEKKAWMLRKAESDVNRTLVTLRLSGARLHIRNRGMKPILQFVLFAIKIKTEPAN